MSETIFALATPPGRGAVAVVRISGPATPSLLDALGVGRLTARRASLRRIYQDLDGRRIEIDQALVLWFPGPRSYTGEDSAELHLHGGRAVVEAVARALTAAGARPAEAGEFTRRAFANGKLDLAQAEAVADLVDAETEAQRRQAVDQLDGALGRLYEGWRRQIVDLLALLEAEIDFPDEDLPGGLAAKVGPQVKALIGELEAALAGAARGEGVRDGYRIALVGAPNAGKSSLFNQLVGREAAIVTPRPGTTRDVLEAVLDVGGFRVVLADTAGVREAEDEIEVEGVKRAKYRARNAHLRIWVIDVCSEDRSLADAIDLLTAGDICIGNKIDLAEPDPNDERFTWARTTGLEEIYLCADSGLGVERLVKHLESRVSGALSGAEFPAVTRVRHRMRLEEARDHLLRSLTALAVGAELSAEDLRLAARALSRVAGRVHPEDVLDVVFSNFCIGK